MSLFGFNCAAISALDRSRTSEDNLAKIRLLARETGKGCTDRATAGRVAVRGLGEVKVNTKQSNVCAIAAVALFFAVGKAFLRAMGLGWRSNRHFFTEIIIILSLAFVGCILARDRH